MEFNNLLEQVHRLSTEMRPKLAMFYVMIRNEEPIRRLVQIVRICVVLWPSLIETDAAQDIHCSVSAYPPLLQPS